MPNDLKNAIKNIKKNYGEAAIYKASDLPLNKNGRISTGSLSLDLVTNGGWPRGRLVEVFGPESSGKTTLSFFAIAEAQKDPDAICVFLDCEKSLDEHSTDYAQSCGVDLDRLTVIKTSEKISAEKVLDIVREFLLDEDPPDVIVIDSLSALVPKEDMEKSFEEQSWATRARVLTKALSVFTAINRKTVIFCINQIRENMKPYGAEYTSPGGKGKDHAMAIRLQVKKGERIMDEKKRDIGHVIKFRAIKNKVGEPNREGAFNFFYSGNIDRYQEAFTIGLINGLITRAGGWYEYKGNKAQGEAGMIQLFKDEPDLFNQIRKEIIS